MTALAQTSVKSFPGTMATRNDAPLSDLESSMFTSAYQSEFSLSRSEGWNDNDEDYFLDTSSQAASQAGYSLAMDQMSPTVSSPGLASQVSANDLWSTDISSHFGGEKMTRWPSQDSTAAHNSWHRKPSITSVSSCFIKPDPHMTLMSPVSQRDGLPSAQALSEPMFSTFNEFTYAEDDLGSADLAGSTLSLFQGPEVFSSFDVSNSAIHAPFPTRGSHAPSWPGTETRRSSPSTLEEAWSNDQVSASHASSPLASASSVRGQSPSVPIKQRISRASSFGTNFASQRRSTGPSSFDQASASAGRASPVESENTARDDPLYQNVVPGSDGLYHCPWEKDGSCNHRPDKLKCNYDKFVDSHLKPYRCKIEACENARFSSTACLLRHEREAHAMHGHGDKPYLCTFEGCERSVPGYGFPRHWNLRDHMKRMHPDPTGAAPAVTSTVVPALKGGRKRKAATSEKPSGKKSQTAATIIPPSQNYTLEPDQLEIWCQKRQMLERAVQQLPQHPDAGSFQLLQDASDCLNVMRSFVLPMSKGESQQSG